MDASRLRWTWVILTFALTLAILIGGNAVYQKYYVRAPLEEAIRASGLATEVSWGEDGQVVVRLQEVPDLKEAYRRLGDILGPHRPLLVVEDRRTPRLNQVWVAGEPAVYEAVARGNFRSMAENIATLARRAGLERWAVRVDQENIYVQLHGDGGYLYAVVPCQPVLGQEVRLSAS